MKRPDRDCKSRSEVWAYIEHLEGRIEALVGDVTAPPVRARRSDPSTSQKARLEHYPAAGKNRHKVLLAIEDAGDHGATSDDLALATGVNGVWKRVSELVQGGWVKAQGDREGRLSGKSQQVYVLTAKGREARAREREGMPPVHPRKADGSRAPYPKSLFEKTEA